MNGDVGVVELAQGLRGIQLGFGLDAVSGTMQCPHGPVTIKICGLHVPVITLEDDQGNVVSPVWLVLER